MDLDGDSLCDRDEIRYSLYECYSAVHGQRNIDSGITTGAGTDESSKQQTVDKQVDWLFTATSEVHHITLQEFKQCYADLLQNAYEEEVLTIDLQRAIKALETSADRQERVQLLQQIIQWYRNATEQQKVTVLQQLQSPQVTQLTPKKHAQIQQYIQNLSTSLNHSEFLGIIKYMLAHDVPLESLKHVFQSAR